MVSFCSIFHDYGINWRFRNGQKLKKLAGTEHVTIVSILFRSKHPKANEFWWNPSLAASFPMPCFPWLHPVALWSACHRQDDVFLPWKILRVWATKENQVFLAHSRNGQLKKLSNWLLAVLAHWEPPFLVSLNGFNPEMFAVACYLASHRFEKSEIPMMKISSMAMKIHPFFGWLLHWNRHKNKHFPWSPQVFPNEKPPFFWGISPSLPWWHQRLILPTKSLSIGLWSINWA